MTSVIEIINSLYVIWNSAPVIPNLNSLVNVLQGVSSGGTLKGLHEKIFFIRRIFKHLFAFHTSRMRLISVAHNDYPFEMCFASLRQRYIISMFYPSITSTTAVLLNYLAPHFILSCHTPREWLIDSVCNVTVSCDKWNRTTRISR